MRRRSHWGRRLGVALVSVGVVVGLTAGATMAKTGVAGGPAVQHKTTITFAHWNATGAELAAVKATERAFQKAYPSIAVKDVSLDPYPEGMLARFAARKPPDIFYVDSNVFPDWVSQGVLAPIGGSLAKAHFSTTKFYPRLLSAFRYKGQLYGLPKDWSPLAMEVNTSALAKAKVKVPKTWAQLTAAARALKAAGQPPMCLGVDLARMLAFMYQNKGAFLNSAKTKAVVNSSANLAAVTTYIGWLKSGLAQTPAQLSVSWCGEALGKEKASIIFEGNWLTDYMHTTFPTVAYKTYPMVRNKTRGNLGFTVSYSISKDSKHKTQALQMLKYLTGPAGMKIWVRTSGFLPSRSDVKPPPGRAIFLKEAPFTHPWQFAPGFSKVYDTANNELQSAYEGKESISTALKNIQKAASDALGG
jgi:multiple sugar transport system substrate-binding protein